MASCTGIIQVVNLKHNSSFHYRLLNSYATSLLHLLERRRQEKKKMFLSQFGTYPPMYWYHIQVDQLRHNSCCHLRLLISYCTTSHGVHLERQGKKDVYVSGTFWYLSWCTILAVSSGFWLSFILHHKCRI